MVFRFGRFNGIKGAELRWIIPGIDRMVRINLREIVMDVPEQDVITRDNVIFPVPIDMLRPFYEVGRRRRTAGEGGGTEG